MEIRKNWKDIAERSKNKKNITAEAKAKLLSKSWIKMIKVCLVEGRTCWENLDKYLFFVKKYNLDRENEVILR